MNNNTTESTLGKVLNQLPVKYFRELISKFRIDKYVKKMFTLKLLWIFIFAQITQAESLTKLSNTIKNNVELQKILGLQSISVSQLSRRLSAISSNCWETMFNQTVAYLLQKTGCQLNKLSNSDRIHIIDASTITLCLNHYRWADYRKTKAGIKIHQALFYHDGMAYPDKAVLTPAKISDKSQLDELVIIAPDVLNIFDRGFTDYDKWDQYCKSNIRFITRLKSNAIIDIIEQRIIENTDIIESIVRLGNPNRKQMENELRLIQTKDTKGNIIVIVTNDFKISAQEISEIYRHRWQIELFFKWLKQHLKVKKFYGKSPNAVYAQLWLALITYCLLLLTKTSSSADITLLELQRLLEVMLFKEYILFLEALRRQSKRASLRRRRKRTDHNHQFEQLVAQIEIKGSAYLDITDTELNYL